jgi:hypothetical protein
MKFGVKTYQDEQFLKHFENSADFFEIMALKFNNYNFIKKLSKIPLVIHVPHEKLGVNIADKTKEQVNLEAIALTIKIANLVKSKKIILHPGKIENSNCSIENAINLLRKFNDSRILLENTNHNSIFSRPDEFELFRGYINGFCLDINHAIIQAIEDNKEPYFYLDDFIKLNPYHYHFGGQIIEANKDHLCLKNSTIDTEKILKLLPSNAEVTLETESDIRKVEEDLKIVREATLKI